MKMIRLATEEVDEVLRRSPKKALNPVTRTQVVLLTICLVIGSIATILIKGFMGWLISGIFVITLVYIIELCIKIPWKINQSFSRNPDIIKDWPSYTLLMPLLDEAAVIPQLVDNLSRIQYRGEIQYIFLVESHDEGTTQSLIWELARRGTPDNWLVLIFPDRGPRTKPRALNVALHTHATGDIVTIYDAEDNPDPRQLEKVALEFIHGPRNLGIIQVPLLTTDDHPGNLIAALFSGTYELHFRIYLPWLVNLGIVPLGGTSCHFKSSMLKGLGGWDPWNVTEDLEVGLRCNIAGWETTMLTHSWTRESPPTTLPVRIRQLTRWQKGYIITFFAYWQKPLEMIKKLGLKKWLAFNVVVGGTAIIPIINPAMWLMTVVYALTRSQWVEQLYPPLTLWLGIITTIFGNYVFWYLMITASIIGERFHLAKYLLLSQLHAFMISFATARGYWQILNGNISGWEKTPHKESKDEEAKSIVAFATTGYSLRDLRD